MNEGGSEGIRKWGHRGKSATLHLPIDDTREQVRGNEMMTNVSSSSLLPRRYTHTHTLPAIVLTPHKPPHAHYAHLATVTSCDYENQPNGWFTRHVRVEEEVVDMVDGSMTAGMGMDEWLCVRAWTQANDSACVLTVPSAMLDTILALPTPTSSPPLIISIYYYYFIIYTKKKHLEWRKINKK